MLLSVNCEIVKNRILNLLVSTLILLTVTSEAFPKDRIVQGGGPSGGALSDIANALQSYKQLKEALNFRVQSQPTEGSIDNIKNIEAGKLQMGIAYSGDLWQASNGQLLHNQVTYKKTLAIAYLCKADAFLFVSADSDIKNIADLENRKVCVGNANSDSYATSELFLTHINLWDKIDKKSALRSEAASALKNGEIDALWLFSPAILSNTGTASAGSRIQILDLAEIARKSLFFKKYPWFSTTIIDGSLFKDILTDTPSFQDSALWVASDDLSADVVYQILSMVYTDEGIKYLSSQNGNLKEMSVTSGIIGIITPLHPGAERFWRDKGVIK